MNVEAAEFMDVAVVEEEIEDVAVAEAEADDKITIHGNENFIPEAKIYDKDQYQSLY